jgi:hypothetical protein
MTGLKDNEVASLLMQEHSFLKAEIVALTNNYKAHVQYSQIGITAIIALFALISQTKAESFFQPGAGTIIFISYAVTAYVGYAAFTIIETQYLINTLGAYLSVQEDKINLLAEKDVIFWEKTLCPALFKWKSVKPKSTYPGGYLFFFQIVLMLMVVIALPIHLLVHPATYHAKLWHIEAAWVNIVLSIVTLAIIARVTSDVLGKDNLWKRTRDIAREQSFPEFENAVRSSRSIGPSSDGTG